LLVLVCAALIFATAYVALRHLTPSSFRAQPSFTPDRQSAEASRDRLIQAELESLRDRDMRKIYPYSIVPGGVKNARELKWAADHDPVVKAHYAGFDYDHARVVRLALAQTAYVSYRIGNKVYWTKRRVKLKKGETVITDGKITARTKCGNRIEVVPEQKTSSLEPPAMMFDEPMPPNLGTAFNQPPVPFESTLVTHNPALGPPLNVYDPIGGGTMIALLPPPLPGVCGVGTKKHPVNPPPGKKKKKGDPCGNGGGSTEVPEPGTWLLMASGIGAMYWMVRRKFARPTQST